MHGGKHSERSADKNDLKVPEMPKRCTGFPYIGPKEYKRGSDNKCLQNPA
jgi:hypothetical protein